jgi:hypothetical protein
VKTFDCDECEDATFVPVGPHYADGIIREPDTDRWEALDDEGKARLRVGIDTRRQHAAASVRPCSQCRPPLYAQWVGGHLDGDHSRTACAVCTGRERLPLPGDEPPSPVGYAPQERRDLA